MWIEKGREIIAVESKLLEYFKPTKPNFSKSYEKLAPPFPKDCWWAIYQEAKHRKEQLLDYAQLLKHYFGLRKFQLSQPELPKLTLLYIFWEPLNWQALEECIHHRKDVEEFTDAVSPSEISFRWLTYTQLWDEWFAEAELAGHA